MGLASLSNDGHHSCLDLAKPPCLVTIIPRSLNETSPRFPEDSSGPRSRSLTSRFSFIKSKILELNRRISLKSLTVSYTRTLCEAKLCLTHHRAGSLTYRTLLWARTRYCAAYYRAKVLLQPLSVSHPLPMLPPPPPPSPPPPPPSRTKGIKLPPTRARTTSPSNPAQPMPAYAWTKGRSCTYEYPEVVSGTSHSTLVTPSRLPPISIDSIAKVVVIIMFTVFACVKTALSIYGLADQPLESTPTMRRVIHYAYELTVEGHRFQMKSLWYQKQWEDSGLYCERGMMERCAWNHVERTLRRFEKECAKEPFLGVALCLKRKKTIFDIYEDQTGTYPIEVPQDHDGVETFTNEDHFNFDPDPETAFIEDPNDDAGPNQAGSGGPENKFWVN
ncbi:hypothetical protein FRC09_015135 [Ceratobasidium sp. 395]|nr:hypothetical protein FRC09_015135 [Ceratobasidium sp. 395]